MIDVLPDLWIAPKLVDICQINPRSKSGLLEDAEVSFIPMAAISETSGSIIATETRRLREVIKGFTPFQEGDVLFAKITPCMENGKAAIARNLVNGRGYGSTEFHVIRPSKLILADWIFALVRSQEFRRAAEASFQGAVGQQRVPSAFIENFRIPLPPLSEQKRIVGILQETEEIRRLRGEAEAKTAQLAEAFFLSIFGLPSQWEDAITLGKLVKIIGGGTPSRRVEHYFGGSIPWATPKDIKKLYIDDTEERITGEAIQHSATNLVPVGTVLVVVKSKILAHSLPIAIAEVPLCFSQDIKGLIPHAGVTPEFLMYSLRVQLSRVLARARGANTEGLTLEALRSVKLPNPISERIKKLTEAFHELRKLGYLDRASRIAFEQDIDSIYAHAFSGQLTNGWREANKEQLAAEGWERDCALKDAETVLSILPKAYIDDEEPNINTTNNIYAELNSQQRELLIQIQRIANNKEYGQYFTAEQLSTMVNGSLHRHPQAIEVHLAVFAVRGLITSLSRYSLEERQPFAGCYRFPLVDKLRNQGEDATINGDMVVSDIRTRIVERQRALFTRNI
jgi:type I restriction enzyme, S subunit